jgi:KRAB domain-containing zinc finger protein
MPSWYTREYTLDQGLECKQGGRSFRQRVDIAVHQNVHSGKWPYENEKSGKAFVPKLSIHPQILHSEDKPMILIGMTSDLAKDLFLCTYKSVRTCKWPYECSNCGKYFTPHASPSSLKVSHHTQPR